MWTTNIATRCPNQCSAIAECLCEAKDAVKRKKCDEGAGSEEKARPWALMSHLVPAVLCPQVAMPMCCYWGFPNTPHEARYMKLCAWVPNLQARDTTFWRFDHAAIAIQDCKSSLSAHLNTSELCGELC